MASKNLQHLFSFPDDIAYLNTASFSPAFKSVEEAGVKAVQRKSRPDFYNNSDLFLPVEDLRKLFAKVIDAEDYMSVATIPSVSYGMANVANNITLNKGDEIIMVEEQFPSNVYTWRTLAETYDARIITIKQPDIIENWSTNILNAITENTAVVAIPQIHWANGIVFDLKSIRAKTKAHDALLIIDGSQSVGAMPFSVKDIQPDALICAGYKWLFGPYGCAYAYYSDYFNTGKPIEENWINREGSEDFKNLVNYQPNYKPHAHRYNMGEQSFFHLLIH